MKKHPILQSSLVFAISFAMFVLNSTLADPPPGYYDSATGLSGSALRAALHEIINDHTIIPYSSTALDTSDALKVLDEDPANTNNVWLLYAQRTEPKSTFGLTTGWNREHMWCNSYGLDDVQPGFSDLHNLRAEDANVNSARGNKFYDISDPGSPGYQNPAHAESPLCSTDSDSWEPPTNVRGDIARATFYMDVRYEGDRANEQNLILTTNVVLISSATNLMGHLAVLLQWHQDDPVDAAEMARNDKVYSLYQNNRNPFVDHPEWVSSIFGGGAPPPSAPVITSQPQNRTVAAGDNVTFSVGASGTAPLSYQWKFNGTDISGATASAYTLLNVQSANQGSYSVLVTNSLGSTLSANATLTVTAGLPGTLAQWNFNSSPPDANTATGTTTPSAGSGTATLVGGASGTFVSGAASDPASGGTDNSGWNTASYPAQGTGNKTAGVKFTVNTTGYRNITITWEHRLSATASKYARLQYSTDGVNFTDHNVITLTVNSAFVFQSHDLSAITGINDNPNAALRVVTEFESTATGSGTAGYVTTSASSYGTGGTIRYDMVTISGTPIPVAPPAAPTDLVATGGNAQVALTWTASSGATSYNVKRATSTGGPYTTIATGVTATSHNDTTVVNGTTYFYVVSALNVGGESADSNEASATPQAPPPAAPTALNASGGNAVVNLTWTQSTSPGITQNNIYRSTTGSGGPYSLLANIAAAASYSDTAVVNGNTYFYFVTAINAGGESASSAYAGATASCPLPATPTGLGATAGNAQVALSWNAASGATSYNVKRATVSGGPYSTIATGVTPTSYTDTTAANGTTYFYVVTAVNVCGETANSNEASATPVCPLPSVPTGLAATAGNAQVALTWNAASGATSYNVKRATESGGSYTTITNVTSTSHTDNTALNGTTYYYVVTAVNGCGETGNSNETSATPVCPLPSVPTGLAATAGNAQVALAWNAAVGATTYNVKRSTTSGGSYTTIATGVTGTSHTDTTAVNGTTYFYVVSAVNSCGETANSNEASGTPVCPLASVPTGLAATAGNAQVSLTWNAAAGATSYNVKRATVNGGPYTTIATGVVTTSYTNTSLVNGTSYYYVVSAVNACGETANSAQTSATPQPPPPLTLTVKSVGADDGWLLESSETSNLGGSRNSNASTTSALRAGDDNKDKQYKCVVSFNTASLPDTATIVSAKLRLRRGTVVGTNPFTTHGACRVDIKGGSGFGGSAALANNDFEAAPDAAAVGTLSNAAANNDWSEGFINATGLSFVNKTGKTQMRVYFATDDNDDLGDDYIGWYSGENATSANQPELVIEYQP